MYINYSYDTYFNGYKTYHYIIENNYIGYRCK